MGFVIPSSRRKLYLSGPDWVINTLDYMMKSATSSGNLSQIVITTDGLLDEHLLRESLTSFLREFPLLGGRVKRDPLNLAPYWWIPKEDSASPRLNISHRPADLSREGILSLLEKDVNRRFGEDEHLAFHLIQKGKKESVFAMAFDHRILDARGAETFLGLFLKSFSDPDIRSSLRPLRLTASAELSDWKNKFVAGRNVNRKMISFSGQSFEILPLPGDSDRGFRFHPIFFDEAETKSIFDAAYTHAGYLMEMPWLLSAVIQAVHRLFERRGLNAVNYMVPVTIDMRKNEDMLRELFLNHVSYLFFIVPADEASASETTVKLLRRQMYDQVKSGLPKDLSEASSLMRIAPLHFLSKVFALPFSGSMASFLFSYLGKDHVESADFMGARITNLFHTPRVPVPPGLGFFFNSFNGRLNLVITYLEGLLTDGELLLLENDIKERTVRSE